MKKALEVVLAVSLLVSLTGCTSRAINPYLAESAIESGERLSQYDSPYTACYKNRDGTYTVYMFSSPISFKDEQGDYEFIDNHIIGTEDQTKSEEGYPYQNAKNNIAAYFPENDGMPFLVQKGEDTLAYSFIKQEDAAASASLKTVRNMYGDSLDGVVYADKNNAVKMNSYATKAGIKNEMVLNRYPGTNKLQFTVKVPNDKPESSGNGYIRFLDGSNAVDWVIASGPMKDSYSKRYTEKDGHFSVQSNVTVKSVAGSDGEYTVTYTLDNDFLTDKSTQYPVYFDTSFESYLNKQPDSGVYSRESTANAYLSPVSVIGNSPAYGKGRQYIRFRFEYFFQCDAANILSATYYLHEFTDFKSSDTVTLNQMQEQWSSTGLTWANKIDSGDVVSTEKVKRSGDIPFDITDYAKACFSDSTMMTESYGLLMKGEEKSDTYRVFASSDNTEYPPYVKITLRDLPTGFTCRDDINPTNY